MHRNSNITGNPNSTFRNAGILNFWCLEDIDNQHCCFCKNTFAFTGKEKDEETGYGYFGARYMDHELMTMWLSVDPMSDKYPSISPYAYCTWNPVKLVDPDGRQLWKPEMLNDGTVNYVAEKGDDAQTLQKQYALNCDDAAKLYATLNNGKISGESVEQITGDEVLKLRWTNNSNSEKAYHLGFAIMYNHEKQGDFSMELNDFFDGMPQSTGAHCTLRSPKYLSDITDKIFGIKNEPFTIPAKGGCSIPVTFLDCTASGKTKMIRDCAGTRSLTEGTVRLQMNYYSPSAGCNGAPVIHIQVPSSYEEKFINSYGH